MAFRRLLLSPLAVFAGALVLSGGSLAAYKATTGPDGNDIDAGSVHLFDDDSGSAMLGIINGGSGASDASCILVSSDGSLPSNLRFRASSSGALASHLQIHVERGSGAAGFDDCSGFAPDERDYYGLGPGVVFDGRLSDLPADWATGISDPSENLLATSISPLLAARTNLVGLWELGERTRRDDDFAGTPAALLTTRTELYGAAWSKHAVSTTNAVFTTQGRIRPQAAGTAIYRQATATGAEIVSADLTVASATGEAGLLTRMATTGDTGYLARYVASTGVWQLATDNAGTIVVLDSWTGPVPDGGTAHLLIDQSGSTIRVLIDGTQRLSATDASIAASGRTGIRLVGVGNQDDASGVHLDNFRSYQPGQASTIASTGTAAAQTGAPVVTAGAQPSPTDDQYGVVFNGTTQTMSLPATGLTTTATIAGWFKLGTGSNLLRDSTTGASAGWSLGYDDGSGTMKFRTSDQVFDTGIPFGSLRGAWHHHAMVRSGSTVDYYLDGRRVFTGTVSGTTAPTSPFILMKDGTAATFTSGRVDQVAIWSRALTPAEIAAVHDAVSAPAEWNQGDSHWYRISATVDESPAASNSSATGQFTWEARSR